MGAADGAGAARPFGQSAVLVGATGRRCGADLAARARSSSPVPLVEVVAALDTAVLVLRPGSSPADIAAVMEAAERWSAEVQVGAPCEAGSPAEGAHGETIDVPCRWDGADLGEVGTATGLGPDGVVAALTGVSLRVACTGFAPGFAYLEGLPDVLCSVGRRPAPRTVVPGGSVAVAGGFAGIYPYPTPGGWQLLGTTPMQLFDPAHPPYARLRAGQEVRFSDVGDWPTDAPALGAPQCPSAAQGPPVLQVEDPGFLTLIEDAGRVGFAGIGVPTAGPVDAHAHVLANRLVGNDAGAAALEATVVGPRLRCVASGHLAVVGSRCQPMLDGRPVPVGTPLPVGPGQMLDVGRLSGAPRATVAVAGGIAPVERTAGDLGSTSTDTLSKLGPGPLAAGDLLARAGPPGPMGGQLAPVWEQWFQAGGVGTCTVLRVLAGPHPEWFSCAALEDLTAVSWAVTADSDRVGVRLRGLGGAGVRPRAGELRSQPMVTGAVQVPPDGQPVILLADHATHGGYPVVAVVIDADIALAGRVGPGSSVQFALVGAQDAHRAWLDRQRMLDAGVLGRFPVRAG